MSPRPLLRFLAATISPSATTSFRPSTRNPATSCTRGEAVGMEIGLRVLDRALRTVTWLLLRAALVVEDLRRKLPRRGRRWRRGLRGFVNRWQARNARPPAVFFRRRSASNRTPE